MKIKPIVMQEINTTHTSFIVDLHLDYNVTFITGDSGVGKSSKTKGLRALYLQEQKDHMRELRGFLAAQPHHSTEFDETPVQHLLAKSDCFF